ncbi:MAG: hypothetical protein ACOYOA_12840 [Saprospiraceae bacterium]
MNPHFDELDLYLDDLLPPIRKAAFEALMESDAEVRDAVASEKAYRAAQAVLAKEELRKQLAAINAEQSGPVKNKPTLSWSYYAIAATLVGVSGLLFWFFSRNDQQSNILLAQKYNIDYPIPTIQGGENNAAYQYLEAQRYSDALAQFALIPAAEKTEEQRFFSAYAYLQLKDFQRAKAEFQAIQSGSYLEAAQWYAIVACLYAGENVKADLKKIVAQPQHAYYAKALELQKEIE